MLVREKDPYTSIGQSMLCSSYGPVDLLVIVCCINKINVKQFLYTVLL